MIANRVNIFEYATKELSTDAFLAYLFIWCQDNQLTDLLAPLLLKDNENGQHELIITHVDMQKNINSKRADLVVSVEAGQNVDGKKKARQVVFENKTNTSTSIRQLESYKLDSPDRKYIYLKLGYISQHERQLCQITGYTAIDSKSLCQILDNVLLEKYDEIISQYRDFINKRYVEHLHKLRQNFLDADNLDPDYRLLKHRDAQLMLAERLAEQMGTLTIDRTQVALDNDYYAISTGSSYGRPYTVILIIKGGYPENIYWRIDKRKHKAKGKNEYYIRLTQYSNSLKHSTEKQRQKKQRLMSHRAFAKDYFKDKEDIHVAKPSNKGENEKEIISFFFTGKALSQLGDELPKFTQAFKMHVREQLMHPH